MTSNGTRLSELVPIIGMFGAAAFRLLPSVNRTIGALQRLIYTAPVVQIISKELGNSNDFEMAPFNETIKRKEMKSEIDLRNWKEIKISNIKYKYPGSNKFVLENLSLNFSRGQSIGIIGSSGEGKSHLLYFTQFLPLNNGSILIDNIDVEKNILSWRSQIGYVPQEIFIIDDTLKRNIALGIKDENINDKKLEKAIELSQLKDFVLSLPNGVDTKVGERGAQISGGQSQGRYRKSYITTPVLFCLMKQLALDVNTENEV